MNPKMKLSTRIAAGAVMIVGLAVPGVAVAQGYGGDSGATQDAPTAQTRVQDAPVRQAPVQDGQGNQVQIQLEGEAPAEDGEREGRRGHRGGCDKYETAAETIGITVDELEAALEDGSTIAEVAEANGVNPQAVIDAMVEDKTERIAEKVAEGDLTQEEADEKLAEKAERISDRVFGTTVFGNEVFGNADA